MLADFNRCTGCSSCSSVCPQACIQMLADHTGFLHPIVDSQLCLNCGLCTQACPVLTSPPLMHTQQSDAFSVACKNDSVRLRSSSGGVFTLLAEQIIHQGGVVFGVAFDQHWDAVHCYVETLDDLVKLCGSKYVQSVIRDSYCQAKAFLDSGRPVLFSGTPCQIGGLKSFLRKDYPHLICVDFVCHGVPSPSVWRKYCSELVARYHAPIRDISFRDKRFGWQSYMLRIAFKNGKIYLASPDLDPYMRAFLSDLTLRNSCFDCSFKGTNHYSDITLADFWGIEHILPSQNDDKGTSLVLTHSAKGKHLLSGVSALIRSEKISYLDALKYNPSATFSAKKTNEYTLFWKEFHARSISSLANRYCPLPSILHLKLKFYYFLKVLRSL